MIAFHGPTILTSTPQLETLEIDPDGPATASVIWMHGLGADAHDFYGIPSQLGLPSGLGVRYVFPNAPQIPVTINMGLIMRAWYDVTGFDRRGEDETRIRQSTESIGRLVAREVERGVSANRVVLAGFSQGGAMALFAGLRYPEVLGGIMCLSGYLLLPDTLPAEGAPASRDVPIFQAHGTEDAVVPHALGLGSCEALVAAGYPVDWHEYPMAHQVCLEEVRDVGDWLTGLLAANETRSG